MKAKSIKYAVFFVWAFGLSLILQAEVPLRWPEAVEKKAAEGFEAALTMAMELKGAAGSTVTLEPLMNRAIELYKEGEQELGILLMEVARRVFPGDIRAYSVLAQLHWYRGDMAKSRELFGYVLSRNPAHQTAREMWKRLCFVPLDFDVPLEMNSEHLRLRPLKASDAELDYRAVMSSVEHIRHSFAPDSTWPSGDLTLDADRKSLAMHEKEFGQRIAFVYTVMNHDLSDCLGCVYVYPSYALGYDADVIYWVTKAAFDQGLEEELRTSLDRWFDDAWPFAKVMYPGRTVPWEEYSKLTDAWEKKDQKE